MLNGTSTFSLLQNKTLKEAETLALKVLKQVMEEKVNDTNVEMGAAVEVKKADGTVERKFVVYDRQQLQAVIARLDGDPFAA